MACMKEHLKTCKVYLKNSANASLQIIEKYNQKRQKIEIQDFIFIIKVKKQTRLKVLTLLQAKQDVKNCIALFKTNKKFKNFKKKDFNIFLYWLNPAFKILSAQLLFKKLLKYYKRLSLDFNKCIYFNFVINKILNK